MTTKIDSSEVRKMIDKRKFAIECAFEIAEDTYIESVRVQPEKRFLWFVIRPEKVRSRKECIEYLNKTADESGLCMFDGWHLIRHRKKYWIEYMEPLESKYVAAEFAATISGESPQVTIETDGDYERIRILIDQRKYTHEQRVDIFVKHFQKVFN